MSFATIDYVCDDGVATLTLNQPERLNAFTAQMRADVMDALGHATGSARALVLTGAGRGFCAGQDLGDLAEPEKANLGRLLSEEYHPVITALAEAPIPTVCAVNGIAAGAGANLALAADIVIAARSASFLQAFARIGLMPDAGGTWWLPRMTGMARAKGMAMLAEPVPAEIAAEWGLIWDVVDDDLLPGKASELATRLAEGPTSAYRRMKQAFRASSGNSLAEQLELEAELQDKCARSRDFKEGVLAFLEKRPPRFEGR